MPLSDILEMGLGEFENGNFKVAEEYFTSVIKGDNSHETYEALKKRATCRTEMKQYEQTIEDAKQVLDMNPRSTSGYALWGNALTKMRKFDEALETLKLGIEIDPNDPEIKAALKTMQTDIIATYESRSEAETSYDAVKMSSQEPYPGDNELEVLETEIMQSWGITNFPDLEVGVQDQQKALKAYKAALQYRKAGNDEQALEKMKESTQHDTANFQLRGELATLLYDMGRYKEAYQQCQCIPADFRPGKYWKLGGQILDALDLPVHAEIWLRHGTKQDREDKSIPMLFQNIRVKRLYGPLTQGSKVKVVFTQYGRAIQATDNVSTGQNIFRDKPAVLAQTLDSLKVPACLNCAKCLMRAEDYFGKDILAKNAELKKMAQKHWPVRPRIGCTECGDKVIYCSTECRDEAWMTFHQVLCVVNNPVVEKLHTICSQYGNLSANSRCWKGVWNASYSPFVLANIWARIICMANTLASQEGRDSPSAADWTMAKSPYRKFIAYGTSSIGQAIPKMFTMMQELFNNESLPPNLRYKISSKEFDGRYFQATCNVQAFSDPAPPYNVFMNNIQHDPKRDAIRIYTTQDPEDAMFAGMFPLHACLNHSCDNNVEVLDGHPGVLVRCKKAIKAGDELFTTYINTKLPRQERRAWLFRGYNFWCHCPRCQYEGDGPEKCTECSKEATKDGKEKYPGCGKCHRAWYCSTVCQKTAWKKGHKKICSTPHSDTSTTAEYYMQQAYSR